MLLNDWSLHSYLACTDVQYMTKTKRLPFPPKTLSLPPSPPSILYPACPSAAIVKLS